MEKETVMLTGKYAGYLLSDIPKKYYIWYRKNVAPTYENQYIHDYINKHYATK